MIAKDNLLDTLASSKIYRDYEQAFSEATGLPVSLRPRESWVLPQRGKKAENPFCAELASKSKSCAACLRVQEKLVSNTTSVPQSVTCEMGLCDAAVPVRQGQQIIGFLQTGQVFCKKPTADQFTRITKKLVEWGIPVTPRLEKLYFQTEVLTPSQYRAMIQLLTIFAEHLAMVGNQLVVQNTNAEPPMITRAKKFIKNNQASDISLGQVAKAVNTSTFYFCKMFKKATGVNFTEYLSRVRLEKAKNLLLNPNLRVSEIAYEVGFQSLTHFNRVFKKIVGQSPTTYRILLSSR